MVLRRKAMTPTREWEAVVVDSVPELDEVVEVTTPAVGAEEDVEEDSAPELLPLSAQKKMLKTGYLPPL